MMSKNTEWYVLSFLQEDRNVETTTYQLMQIGFRGAIKNCEWFCHFKECQNSGEIMYVFDVLNQ